MRRMTALLPLMVASSVFADTPDDMDSSLMLGLGVAYEESIYKGADDETTVMPMIAYERGDFYLRGLEAGYELLETDRLGLSVLTRYRMDGYEASDSRDLAGMAERKGAFELGLSASLDSDYGEWSATAAADISGEHKGYELELGWEQRIRLSQDWALTPEASLSYRSADLNNYYYGVRASEATLSRAAYTADSGTVYGLGLNADYQIDEQQQLRFGASYQHYSSEITDSSIVEDDNSLSLHALYLYRF